MPLTTTMGESQYLLNRSNSSSKLSMEILAIPWEMMATRVVV
jgi:hypothetical protein